MKFAIVDSFPQFKNAETECIIRIKKAAESLGYECRVIDSDGYFLDSAGHISDANVEVEFILINHFISPNLFDKYAYTVMWNPVQFLSQWGYNETTTNILTCDDFLAYDSKILIGHLNSMLQPAGRIADGFLSFVPSCFGDLLPPKIATIQHPKIFYCGINWERVGHKKGRHHDLFQALDKMKIMEFYGPVVFAGSRPWKGFKSFKGDIPFDGTSVVKKVNEASIALILSSNAHRESHAPTNRLYEACAAGALIISDDNPFVQRVFSDTVLYVKYEKDHNKMASTIKAHFDWAKENPELAKQKALASQAIYQNNFTMEGQLKRLASFHPQRKTTILENAYGSIPQSIGLFIYLQTASELALRTLRSLTKINIGHHQLGMTIYCPHEAVVFVESFTKTNNMPNIKVTAYTNGLSFGAVLKQNQKELLNENADLYSFLTEGEELYPNSLMHNAGALEKDRNALAIVSPFCKRKICEKTGATKYKLESLKLFKDPSSLLELKENVPACAILIRKDLLSDFEKWPIELGQSKLFSFITLKAFLLGKHIVGQKVTSIIDKEAPAYKKLYGKLDIEALSLGEYFRNMLPVIVSDYMGRRFIGERTERRIIGIVERRLTFRLFGRTPVEWLKHILRLLKILKPKDD